MDIIKRRSELYKTIREFMTARSIMEVETPILSSTGISDPFIDMITAHSRLPGLSALYLHTSPEFCMKRLLASGSGDIFQIARVFRDDEQGKQHTLEFAMLEWYRLEFDYLALINELIDLLNILGIPQPARITYAELFQQVIGVHPVDSDTATLRTIAMKAGWENAGHDRHQLLDFLFTHHINKEISTQKSLIIYDYPACMSALARLKSEDSGLCERFELFLDGMEIANGFSELTDAKEQRKRFELELETRQRQGKSVAPLDEFFLAALEAGLPDCAGVAVGLDRLLMVLLGVENIKDIQAFTLDNN